MSMSRRSLGLLALTLVLGLVTAACGGGGSGQSNEGGGTMTIGKDKANDHGSKDVSGESSFDLEADNDGNDFYFDPTVLQGSAGQTLTIKVENEGDTKHNFTIEDQNIDEDVDPGKDVEVTVTFPQSGVVEFFCEYHRTLGMAGELTTT